MGDMITGELAVHGWDLPGRDRQRLELSADLLAHRHDMVFASAEQAREMGMYGPKAAFCLCDKGRDQIRRASARHSVCRRLFSTG